MCLSSVKMICTKLAHINDLTASRVFRTRILL